MSESDPWAPEGSSSASSSVAVAEPLVIEAEPRVERHVEIVDTSRGHAVVTVIEVLSPSNKIGDRGREQYRRKQRAYTQAGVNLVEIDLLSEGDYILAAPLAEIPVRRRATYAACAYRAAQQRWEVYPISLREPLPTFRVPLRPKDQDVTINLQSILEECYSDGRYGQDIDYASEPETVKDANDLAWMADLLKDKGLRAS